MALFEAIQLVQGLHHQRRAEREARALARLRLEEAQRAAASQRIMLQPDVSLAPGSVPLYRGREIPPQALLVERSGVMEYDYKAGTQALEEVEMHDWLNGKNPDWEHNEVEA